MPSTCVMFQNGQLNYKEISSRITKALEPLRNQLAYTIFGNKLKNSIYVSIDCKQQLHKIRISNHDNEVFEGLNIIVKENNFGIVKPIRKFANNLIKNTKVDFSKESIIKRQFSRQSLESLSTTQLHDLQHRVMEILSKRNTLDLTDFEEFPELEGL